MWWDYKYSAIKYNLYFIPDSSHMLKLARNAQSELGCFIDGDGGLIEWRYFVNLHDEPIEEGLKFANKLSSSHIFYKRQKVNVRLAAQTL